MPNFSQGLICALMLTAVVNKAIALPCSSNFTNQPPIPTSDNSLTLEGVLSHIRSASPEVRLAGLNTLAQSADADQAGRFLNPSLSAQVENFAGSGPLGGTKQAEITLSYEQVLELGDKRIKRERAARAKAALVNAECLQILKQSELEASLIYFELVTAVQLAEFAQQSAELSATLAQLVSKRVEAGAAAPPERLRAQSAASISQAMALSAEGQVEQYRYELAALWGEQAPTFEVYKANSLEVNVSEELLNSRVKWHPQLVSARAGELANSAELDAAESLSIPDISLSLGIRRFEQTGDNAFLVGATVPLPIFDRNRDAIRAASYRVQAQQVSAAQVEIKLKTKQQIAAAGVRAAQGRLKLLEKEALPAAELAYQASVIGYKAGRFDLTSTLNARQELIDVGVSTIHARGALHKELMQLKSLTGSEPFAGEF